MKISAAVLALLLSLFASAQVMKYSDFAEGPARHLMTKGDMKQWKALQSDAEAEAFIALFWAKRDPTPATERNELKEEFDRRVQFADDNFTTGRFRGAMSDAGRVFILLGPPYRVSGKAGKEAQGMNTFGGTTAPTDSQGNLVLGQATSESNKMYWMYAHDKKPRAVSDQDFTITFADEGQNDWKLGFTERANPEQLLLQAINSFIISPKMTKVPEYPRAAPVLKTTFDDKDIETAYQAMRATPPADLRSSNLWWSEFVTSESDHFVGAQIYLPKGADLAGRNATAFTVLENAEGVIVDVQEKPATITAIGTDAFVETSKLVQAGTYTATIGVESGGKLIAAHRVPMKIEGLDAKAVGVSPLILASSVYPLKTTWRPTDPFTFGGLKVVPKGDGEFAPGGDLWYFVELRNPGLADTGLPLVRVEIDIKGKTPKGPVELKIPMKDASVAKLVGETTRFGLGLAIPLDGFFPGEYTVKIHVQDVILGKEYDLQKPFRVSGS